MPRALNRTIHEYSCISSQIFAIENETSLLTRHPSHILVGTLASDFGSSGMGWDTEKDIADYLPVPFMPMSR